MADEINREFMPPQEGFTIDLSNLDGFAANPNSDDYETEEGEMPQPSFMTRAFGSNDIHITYLEMEPGEGIPWHTHAQDMYQVYTILKGTFRVSFKDKDGEIHTAEVSAEDNKLIYLPPGAHNRVESVGDDTLHLLSMKKETRITRVDYLVGDADDAYDPWSDPAYGLEIDTMRGKVLQRQDDAVEPY